MKLKDELGLSELVAIATSAGLVGGTLYYLGFFHRMGSHFILTLSINDLIIGVAIGMVSLAFGALAGAAVRPMLRAEGFVADREDAGQSAWSKMTRLEKFEPIHFVMYFPSHLAKTGKGWIAIILLLLATIAIWIGVSLGEGRVVLGLLLPLIAVSFAWLGMAAAYDISRGGMVLLLAVCVAALLFTLGRISFEGAYARRGKPDVVTAGSTTIEGYVLLTTSSAVFVRVGTSVRMFPRGDDLQIEKVLGE